VPRYLKHPAARIALAIGLSLLLHAMLLFGPRLMTPSPVEPSLPPLTARLMPLPASKPVPVKKRPRKPAARTVISEETAHAQLPPPAIQPPQDQASAAAPVQTPAKAPEEAPAEKNAAPANPLPRHAELTFAVYMGTDLPIGEVRHRLDISDDQHYTLQVTIHTTGLARLLKTFVMNQQSTGTMTARGLRPDSYREDKLTSKGNETLSAEFDWQDNLLKFSSGASTALPRDAQDILSVLYQLSQMPLDQPGLAMHVSNGKKLESYELETGPEENVQTRMGLLRAILLRKIHGPDEEGLKIWLGLEYRLLPIKVQQLDKKDRVIGEIDISSIRVSDE
jgi:hypothetical protein